MKNIIVQNKIDLEKSANNKELESEVAELINNKKNIETIKISTKDKSGIDELIIKINKAVNESKNELPMNIISESVDNKQKLVNSQGYLSFILIGDTEVGKTCFFNRYFRDTFSFDFLSTIGIEKESKLVKINNEIYKITLWDTAGQERFKSLPRKYYQNADGVFLLFDVNKEETFNNVSNWVNDIKENSNLVVGQGGEVQIPLFLLGNKIDSLERVISREQGKKLATSLGMKYFEISCKINMNVTEVMSTIIYDCYEKIENLGGGAKLDRKKTKKRKGNNGCCGGGNSKK
jgi:small GTP-binding protein